MCKHCKMSLAHQQTLDLWADQETDTDIQIIARFTAETHPNTFVYVLKSCVRIGEYLYDLYVDVHYQGKAIKSGEPRLALGGIWLKASGKGPRIEGDMKPEQHGGALKTKLEGLTGATAPAKWHTSWGKKN